MAMSSGLARLSVAAALAGVVALAVLGEGGFLRAGGGSTGSAAAAAFNINDISSASAGGLGNVDWLSWTKLSKGCKGNDCRKEFGSKEPTTFEASAPAETKSSCKCTATFQDDCTCGSDCTKDEVLLMCEEIHGACACMRTENSVCECTGYCHETKDRITACEDEVGCSWTGAWCEAQTGLMWS
mmetsp:Transcript_114954/g.287303  ORF Transcript_114954/g.287303 Transcript_114954/m.287303 type:complete len:184 (-) Transcript_114954:137-688(-)